MEKNKFILVSFILILLAGCQQNKTVDLKSAELTLSIKIDKENPFLSADSVFKSVEYIPLETTDESIFYEIDKTVFEKDVFYILDYQASVILTFGKDGKFLGKLSRKGQGPEEYLSIDDFFISDDLIYILSQDNQRIYIYDTAFNFREYFEIHTHASKISCTDSDIYVYTNFSSRELKNIYIIDKESKKIKHRYAPFLREQRGGGYNKTTFAFHDNTVYAFYPYDYSIYKLSETNQEKYISLDFGSKNMYPASFLDLSAKERKEYNKSTYSSPCESPISGIGDLYLSDDFLLFTFVVDCFGHSFILDRKSNEYYSGYIHSSPLYPFYSSQNNVVINDCLITYTSSEAIIDIIEHPENKTLEIPESFKGLSFTDNPVLCIYKLK
jgi:hypothetical protein